MTQVWTATASFNFADLQKPVPYSIYSSQPWCQTYLRNQGCQGTCPTDTPYKPIVVVPPDVLQALRPEWADCFGDIRGAYDPPRALQEEGSAVAPTQPDPTGDGPPKPTSSTPATPADGPGPTTPAPTGGADTGPTLDPDPQADQNPESTNGGNDGQAEPTQNAGGIIASLLGPSSGDGNADTPTTTQNAGGVIASLLGGTTDGAQDGQSGSQDDPVQTGNDPAEETGGQLAGTQAGPSGPAASSFDGSISTGEDGNGSDQPPPAAVATIGSETITAVPVTGTGRSQSSSAIEVAYGGSTTTMTPGQAATVGGSQVSVASNGAIVYGSGSEQTTLAVATQASTGGSGDSTGSGINGSSGEVGGTSTGASSSGDAGATSSGVEQQGAGNGVARVGVSWWMSLFSGMAVMAL